MCKTCSCSSAVNTENIVLKADGIRVVDCAKIKKALLKLPGVYHVHVNYIFNQVKIDYDSRLTSTTDITWEFESATGLTPWFLAVKANSTAV